MKREGEKIKRVKLPLHWSSALTVIALRKNLEAKANSKGGFGRKENQLYKLAYLPSQPLLCVPAVKAFSLTFTIFRLAFLSIRDKPWLNIFIFFPKFQ